MTKVNLSDINNPVAKADYGEKGSATITLIDKSYHTCEVVLNIQVFLGTHKTSITSTKNFINIEESVKIILEDAGKLIGNSPNYKEVFGVLSENLLTTLEVNLDP